MSVHKVQKIIQVHPPEADAVAKAFGNAQTSVSDTLDRLKAVFETLTREWEGHQKDLFMESFGKTISRIRTNILPGLDINKRKYQAYKTEKVIEVTEHY